MPDIFPIELDFFTARLKTRNPIAFVRMGDGEFNAILGRDGENCDHHFYFRELGSELAQTLQIPRTGNYLYALGPKAHRVMSQEVNAWLEDYAPDISWNNSEVFLQASLHGQLGSLLKELYERRVLLVGAEHLQKWPGGLPEHWQFLQVPTTNAWLAKKEIRGEIFSRSNQLDVILLCAGMVSKVLAWELFPHIGSRVHLLDFGSVFDMYCGKDSRTYARRLMLQEKQELLRMNFQSILTNV